MTEISSAIAARLEPRLHVAIIGAFGIGDREQEAFTAIEKAEAPNIGAQERPQPVGDPAAERYAAAGCYQHLRARRRIAIHAPDRVLEPDDRIVQERFGETAYLALANDPLMHQIVGETRAAAAEQPQDVIGRPARMPHLTAEEARAARHFVAIDAVPPDGLRDRARQRRAHPLVGIDRKDPLAAGERKGEVLLRAKSMPRRARDARTLGPGDVG